MATKHDRAPAFALPRRTAEMLRADLEIAGIPPKDPNGRVVDFHTLRHTFITKLARSGVHPKVAQNLARHCTIALTMDRYSHTLREDERAALDALPDLSTPPKQQAAVTADGQEKPAENLVPGLVEKESVEHIPTHRRAVAEGTEACGRCRENAEETGRNGDSGLQYNGAFKFGPVTELADVADLKSAAPARLSCVVNTTYDHAENRACAMLAPMGRFDTLGGGRVTSD